MKFVVIFMISCALFSHLPGHLAQVNGPTLSSRPSPSPSPSSVPGPERSKEPKWCSDKEVFNGTCTDRGNPSWTCFLDFLDRRSASAMPKDCKCTPQSKDKHLCQCLVVCNNF